MGIPDSDCIFHTTDRQGELFYYMHQQMLARYDADRIAVGLPRVEPYIDWRQPIKVNTIRDQFQSSNCVNKKSSYTINLTYIFCNVTALNNNDS